MKNFIILYCLALFAANTVSAQRLSTDAQFSLLTVTPGNDLYSSFGHSAFLLLDSAAGISRVYNYGTFDFDDPDFYVNFTRGKLKYRLSVEDPDMFGNYLAYEGRGIIKQILNLSPAQKQRLFDFLETNYLPANRYYKYDFFYDNCSSRLRDALVSVCGDSLSFNLKPDPEEKSFRDLIDPYLENKRYQDMGMDVGLGLPADKIATPYQYMFLPDHLMNAFNSATIKVNGREEKLVSLQKTVMQQTVPTPTTPFFLKPWFALWLFFFLILGITWRQYKKQVNGFWLDGILFTFTGLLGLLILFLWFGTDHGVTVKNYNLIWAMPLNLVFVVLLLLKKKQKMVTNYFLIYFFALFMVLVFWYPIPQELNINTLPFIMALALRSMYIYYRLDQKRVL